MFGEQPAEQVEGETADAAEADEGLEEAALETGEAEVFGEDLEHSRDA